MSEPPYPDLDSLLTMIGEAGRRLSEIDASEGAAGNISVCIGLPIDAKPRFRQVEMYRLPVAVPGLAGATLIVTGSGRRLRDLLLDPEANLCCLSVEPGGQTALLYSSTRRTFARPTSELNSHLAVHQQRRLAKGSNFHALVHAQPPHLTYLSHIPAYQDELFLNQHLLRWEPETIIQMPEGMGVLPFQVPGSLELVDATLGSLKRHPLAVWSRHGVMARSDTSVLHATDLIDYAEAAARFEYMNLLAGEPSEGLSADEIRAICRSVNVEQEIF